MSQVEGDDNAPRYDAACLRFIGRYVSSFCFDDPVHPPSPDLLRTLIDLVGSFCFFVGELSSIERSAVQ